MQVLGRRLQCLTAPVNQGGGLLWAHLICVSSAVQGAVWEEINKCKLMIFTLSHRGPVCLLTPY